MSTAPRFEQLHIFPDSPTDADVPLARIMVHKAKKELEELKARVAELEKYIARTERFIFSINRLPPEILSLVFLYTLLPPTAPPPRQVVLAAPWLVSQVCKHWRRVALASHELWSFPAIHLYPNQSISQLNLHLSRSGNVRLHPTLAAEPRTMRHLSYLLRTVVGSSARWSTLILAFDWTLPNLQAQLASLQGNVSELEELQIEGVWSQGTALAEGDRLKVFSLAPRLRKLSVKSVCEPVVSLVIPWHQLTHYRAVGTAHEHLSVLRRCPTLIAVDLIFSTASSVAVEAPPVQLPHLVQIRVDSEFLRVLSLPNVQDISVQRGPEGDAFIPLLDLIRRDHPPLASVSLVRSALVAPTLVSVVEQSPMIETLRIHVGRGDTAAVNEFIARLTIDPTHVDCFAPNLATLELNGRGAYDQERLVAMVKSRREYPAIQTGCRCRPIRRLVIETAPNKTLSSTTVEDLRALMRTGLYLSISTSFLSNGAADPPYWITNFALWKSWN
ncbi:F-box domain-containing protein [Mycena sanguinolenta]|uniref:F-box domain-containing protein n=1 Tax=Mycena sanguinolenta TaxID=230812 RepID=A0A8H6X9Z3_9AGAR|nr:F-box domain-containing protein [Mycena sanguinolenta]